MTADRRTPAPRRAPADEILGKALDRTLLRRVFSYVWPYRRELAVAVALLPIVSLCEVAQPYLLKKAIDEHIAVGRGAGLARIGLGYLAALAGQYGAGFAQIYLTQVVGQRGMNALRVAVHRHVLSLSASFFDRTPVGRLMTRLTSDIEALNEMFASGVVSLLGDAIRLVFILVAMFGIDWRLALFSLASAPVLFGIASLFRRLVRDAFREIRLKLARMNAFLQEHLSGIKVVQAFAQEARVDGEFDVINLDYRRANARAISADAALYAIVEAVGAIAVAALLWHGGGRIAGGTLTFGDPGGVRRVPGQVLRADPGPVDQVHGHAAGHGGGRAGVRAAGHRRARRAARSRSWPRRASAGPADPPRRRDASATAPIARCWTTCRCRSRPARPSPSWAPPAPASRRSSSCCRAFTTCSTAPSASAASTSGRWTRAACAGGSWSSARTCSCSPARCARTSRSATRR